MLFWLLFRALDGRHAAGLGDPARSAWEILENTDFIINRYREATISLDYFGDIDHQFGLRHAVRWCWALSLAARLPIWVTVALALVFEIGVGYLIRDNLTLNVIMLLHPFESSGSGKVDFRT